MAVIVVKAESAAHFHAAALLHRDGIAEGFLSTLGAPFLTALYRGIARTEGGGVLVAVEGSVVLGFISYARDVKACYKRVLKANCFPLALAMAPNAFKPAIYKKVVETLLYPFLHRDVPESAGAVRGGGLRPELLSMAVAVAARGKGVGKLLVKALDEEMFRMAIEGYYVVTHGVDERSNGFYQSCGFAKIHEFKNHGKPMNEYHKNLR